MVARTPCFSSDGYGPAQAGRKPGRWLVSTGAETKVKRGIRMRRLLFTIAGLLLLLPFAQAEELPVDYFFKNPEFTQVEVSPAGTHIAAVAPVGGRRNLVVLDLESMQATAVTNLTGKQTDIAGYTWATNDRLLFFVDADGNEAFSVFAVDRDGRNGRTLFQGAAGVTFFPTSMNILNLLEDDPEHILVSINEKRKAYPDVYRMNINTGRKTVELSNPGYVQGWLADHDGVVRAGLSDTGEPDKLIQRIIYRADEESEWVTLDEFGWEDHGWSPVGFTADNSKMYVQSNIGRDTTALYTYDPESRKMGEMIYGRDDVDVGGPVLTRKTRELVAVSYQTDRARLHYVDPAWAAIQAGIDEAFPDTVNRFTSIDRNDNRLILVSGGDRVPPTYYLYDRGANKLRFLVKAMPWVDPGKMSEVRYISYKARDGETIHGYLTVPNGKEARDLPLIIHPHGGPYGVRDGWGFNPELQFLANRGYAVLQMNYRGSGGYGKRFMDIAWGKWGLEMQDDVTDGLRWAVREGIADPERICIYGASYGGYATMAGVTMTPDLYQCAVNYVGVVDLAMLHKWDSQVAALQAWFERAIGHPKKDKERFAATSPINLVERIKAPLFVVHGERDPRVEIKQARVLIRELRKHKKDHEVLIKEREGHGFRKEENRLELYAMMDQFFKKHL